MAGRDINIFCIIQKCSESVFCSIALLIYQPIKPERAY